MTVNAVQVLRSADNGPPARACTAFECTNSHYETQYFRMKEWTCGWGLGLSHWLMKLEVVLRIVYGQSEDGSGLCDHKHLPLERDGESSLRWYIDLIRTE